MSFENTIDTVIVPLANASGPVHSLARKSEQVVYIVDDEKAVGEIVELLFQLQGFQTRLFSSPDAALETFRCDPHRPGLLVTDYIMSPMNGMELIAQCLKIDPKLKTILISGNVSEDILQGHSAQPGAFVRKPFAGDMLTRTAQKLLDGLVQDK